MKNIFIVGPTATGKTDLALSLVPVLLHFPEVVGVDILSADSKQVYTGEDIVTGKDKEKYKNSSIKYKGKLCVFGIDVVRPDEEWSVAHFLSYAKQVFENAQKEKRLVIVVGGTGQYLSSLISPPETATVPRNGTLRQELNMLPLEGQQQRLRETDMRKWESMNASDRQNPRRIIRAIEVAVSGDRPTEKTKKEAGESLSQKNILWIGLTATKESLKKRIEKRVGERIATGAMEEAYTLHHLYPAWTKEARSAIGYGEIELFLQGKSSAEGVAHLWVLHEVQYAKRQLTWFRKHGGIVWFDCDDTGVKTKVAKEVVDWYTEHQVGDTYGDNED